MTLFAPATPADRDAATAFVGRVAQLDPAGLVRLVGSTGTAVGSTGTAVGAAGARDGAVDAAGGAVDLWARAGFGVVATRRVAGRIDPDPLTVYATNLVAALAVSLATVVDPGADAGGEWRAQVPPVGGWETVGQLATADVVEQVRAARVVADAAVTIDRADEWRAKTKATVPPSVLDRTLLDVPVGEWRIPIAMRMLFALSGMGFADPAVGDTVQVRVTATWLRLDTAAGSVARRRMADLPHGLT